MVIVGNDMCGQRFYGASTNTGHTQKNGAVLIVNTIKTAPLFCVCPVLCTILTSVVITSCDSVLSSRARQCGFTPSSEFQMGVINYMYWRAASLMLHLCELLCCVYLLCRLALCLDGF
jgi:hypothetical protein